MSMRLLRSWIQFLVLVQHPWYFIGKILWFKGLGSLIDDLIKYAEESTGLKVT